jgi:hypothetical protein
MNNPPAFPIADLWHNELKQYNGMSLRDYMAAKAMQALLAGSFTESGQEGIEANRMPNQNVEDLIASTAYEYADAMLKAREK